MFALPIAGASAQSEPSARAAFLEASQAGDLARMKQLMAPSVTTIGDETITADEFLELIEGCSQSFVGKALISWKCGGDHPRVVSVDLSDGPQRVSLSGLSQIAVQPMRAPASGEE
jgi:hypothetical protein